MAVILSRHIYFARATTMVPSTKSTYMRSFKVPGLLKLHIVVLVQNEKDVGTLCAEASQQQTLNSISGLKKKILEHEMCSQSESVFF